LLKNYHQFRTLTIDYEKTISYDEKITKTIFKYLNILIILSVNTMICGMVMLMIQSKIEAVIESLYTLLNFVEHKSFKENIENFSKKQ
jgi:hypothetical protein